MKYEKNNFNSIEIYLKEINKYPLLTRDEENELGKRILKGEKDAIHKMINSNLRFVVKIAKVYLGRDLPFQDLIEEGNLGLITAAKRWDYKKNVKFSSYASWWIKQSIIKSIDDKSRMIRIPLSKMNLIHKIFDVSRELEGISTYKDISKGMNELYDIIISPKKIKDLLNVYRGYFSLESEHIYDDISLKEVIEDDRINIEEKVINNFLKEDIFKLIERVKKLNKNDKFIERDIDILLSKFGFDDGAEKTLENLGKKFNISRERVRQIINKIYKRIGENKESLRCYL